MRSQRLFGFAYWGAVLAAVTEFVASTLHLIGYGISAGMVSERAAGDLAGVVRVLRVQLPAMIGVIEAVLALSVGLVYTALARIAQDDGAALRTRLAQLMLLATLAIHALSALAVNSRAFVMALPFRTNVAHAVFGFLMIIFGAALISWRTNPSVLRAPLGVFYVIEGVVLVSTWALPIRLVELTIAIRVVEAAWFRQLARAETTGVDARSEPAAEPA